jgi:hypothetical protein
LLARVGPAIVGRALTIFLGLAWEKFALAIIERIGLVVLGTVRFGPGTWFHRMPPER